MRAIIFLAGAAMAASFALTWVEVPFAGPDLSPAAALQDGMIDLGGGAWQAYVFLGGFALAALSAAFALFGGGGAGPFALLAGLSPVVVLGDAFLRFEEVRRDLNLPFPIEINDMADAAAIADDFLRLGVWAYLGGALLLIIAGLASLTGR